ncbi:MAG: DUF2634 domain-containing protein [Chloroflexia bacterium]|nr:DUF2634 domain-containing protein [Chloroflexia bacterium]
MTVFRYDPDSLGTDIAWNDDLDPTFSLVSGLENVKQSAYRRLITDRGTLHYELGYGLDLTDYVNADVSRQSMIDLQRSIRNELLKDERIVEADVTIEWLGEADTMKIKTQCFTSFGSFEQILTVNQLGVGFEAAT